MTFHSTELWPSWTEMVNIGQRITTAIPEITLPDHQVHLLNLRPYQMPLGWKINTHEHSFYETSIILAGQAQYDTPPARQYLEPGHVIYHGPRMPHTWSAPEQSCLRLIIWFTVEPHMPVPGYQHWPHWPALIVRYCSVISGDTRRNHRVARPGSRSTSHHHRQCADAGYTAGIA